MLHLARHGRAGATDVPRMHLLTLLAVIVATPSGGCDGLLATLKACPALAEPENDQFREDLEHAAGDEESVLLHVPHSRRRVFAVHAVWSVGLAGVSPHRYFR